MRERAGEEGGGGKQTDTESERGTNKQALLTDRRVAELRTYRQLCRKSVSD